MTQTQVLDILKMGENVFLTGHAGAGKTFVLNTYIKYLKENNIPVAVTASTGIAATHLGGTTIHSWSGIGIQNKLSETDIKKLLKKAYLKNHYLTTSVLIIDEVSMLSAAQLDLVNQLCQIFRQDLRPFGGLQVVLSGDFFQLPPISSDKQPTNFITAAKVWPEMNLRVCYLTQQFRQEDTSFINILNEIRSGQVSSSSQQLLMDKINQDLEFTFEPTKLYTHNIDVDSINLIELAKIKQPSKTYLMTVTGHKQIIESLIKSCLAPEKLVLKLGAKVMFVKNNFAQGIVNGTLGEVIGFDKFSDYPQVKITSGRIISVKPESWSIDENGKILAEISQFPLRLAWAITVHKSQGMSLDFAEIDLSKAFVPGMGYVALSRVRSLVGLKLIGFNQTALQVNPQILALDKILQTSSSNNLKFLKKISSQELHQRQQDFIKQHTLETEIIKLKPHKKPNHLKTLELIQQELTLAQIAEIQNLKINTIINHLEKLITNNTPLELDYLMPAKQDYQIIVKSFTKCGLKKLKPVFEDLAEKYSYDVLKLVRLYLLNLKHK